jgi:excisionase family DNA binding protein
MESDHEVLTIKEVSEILQVHLFTVYKLVKEGKIPGFRNGSVWRVRAEQLVRWITEQWRPQ